MSNPKGPYESDETNAGPTIHVPASGPVADAPKPNAAEPYNEAERVTGIERVDQELASEDNDPSRAIKDGVQNPYISEHTKEGGENADNAAMTPATYADETGRPELHPTAPAADFNDTADDDDDDGEDDEAADDDDDVDDDDTPSEPVV